MAFVREKIPDDVREKYQINKLNYGRGDTLWVLLWGLACFFTKLS